MRQDDPNSPGNYTYSDAMNDWASQQDSFMRRSRGKIFHPGDSTGLARLFGYAWRLVVLALLLTGVTFLFLRSHIRTQEFADDVAALLASEFGAGSAEITAFRWKGSNAISPAFAATGSNSTFFRTAEGRHLSFDRPIWRLFGTEWNLGKLTIGELDIELQAGGVGAIPEVPAGGPGLPVFPTDAAPETDLNIDRLRLDEPSENGTAEPDKYLLDLNIKSGGFAPSLSPRPDRLTFSTVEIALLDARWGLNDQTRGSLSDALVTVSRDANDSGAWVITANSGTLQQNWLRDLRLISPLVVNFRDGTLTFQPCEVEFGQSGGTGTLSGTVTTGDTPQVDLTLTLEGVPLGNFLAAFPDFNQRVSGDLHGQIHVTGSTNTSDGLAVAMDAKLSSGTLRGIALLDVLALPTSHDAFRHLPVSGKFSLVSAGLRTEMRDIEFASGDDVRIAGTVAHVTQQLEVEPEFGAEAAPDEALPAPELPDLLEGVLKVGVTEALLEGFPGVRERFFEPGDDGFVWMQSAFSGEGPRFTGDDATAVLSAYRADKEASERNRARSTR